jgi:hypothetical protein
MISNTYRRMGNIRLFDREDTADKLRKIGNPLEKLSPVIDFEMFRPILEAELLNHDKSMLVQSRLMFC